MDLYHSGGSLPGSCKELLLVSMEPGLGAFFQTVSLTPATKALGGLSI